MEIVIYGLVDPLTNEVRYIGRTKQKLSIRLNQHLSLYPSNHGSYKKHWIQKLKREGLKPKIITLKKLECTWEESYLIEQSLIQEYIFKGFKLTNLEDKGSGTLIKCIVKTGQKSVLQYNLEGDFLKEYCSLSDAAKAVNGKLKGIHKGLNNCNTAYGFQWKYKQNNYSLKIEKVVQNNKLKKQVKIIQFSLDNQIIKIWDSITEAAEFIGDRNISNCLAERQNTCKGFKWKYYNK